MKKGAIIGVFPCGTIMRSSLAVDPTRNSLAMAPQYKKPSISLFSRTVVLQDTETELLDFAIVRETAHLLHREDYPEPY